MQVEQFALTKKKAQQQYEAYKEELRHAKTQFNQDMRAIYGHMRHGGKVIDVWESMKLAGLNQDGDPKLAIIRADSKRVRFVRKGVWQNGSYVSDGGLFRRYRNTSSKWDTLRDDIRIPAKFFPDWGYDTKGNLKSNRTVETITPIVPANVMNPLRSHKLENYHILWEVEKWELLPPRDPILLKKVTPNMFLVLGSWDLTELERAVIRGRL